MRNVFLFFTAVMLHQDQIPKECEAYLEEGNKNETIYRTRNSNLDSKLEVLLNHSKNLLNIGNNSSKDIKNLESFQLLVRMLQEQTTIDENNNLTAKAGVEGIPSVLRRRYKVDTMPVRGLLRSKLWVGFKIAAYNFKKLLAQFLSQGINALTSLFLAAIISFFRKFNFYGLKVELNPAS